jgi:hypothetical protein
LESITYITSLPRFAAVSTRRSFHTDVALNYGDRLTRAPCCVFVKEQTAETQLLTGTAVSAMTMTMTVTTRIPRSMYSCGVCGYVHSVNGYYDGNSFAAQRK